MKDNVGPDGNSEEFAALQRGALAAIAAKAGTRLPIIQGKDKGLPKNAPVFDLEELRRKNDLIAKKGRQKSVG